jgi:hypothetical protein
MKLRTFESSTKHAVLFHHSNIKRCSEQMTAHPQLRCSVIHVLFLQRAVLKPCFPDRRMLCALNARLAQCGLLYGGDAVRQLFLGVSSQKEGTKLEFNFLKRVTNALSLLH